MKKLVFILIMAWSVMTLAADYPSALTVHPDGSKLIVGHQSGRIFIVAEKGLKYENSIKLCQKIEGLCFDSSGDYLWVSGLLNDNKRSLMVFNSKSFELIQSWECERAVFSFSGNRVSFKKDYFSQEIKTLDLSTRESLGTIKAKFTKQDARIGYFELSGDGTQLIVVESVFGDGSAEVLVYPSEGLVASPLNSYENGTDVSTGFGSGVCTKVGGHIVIGWSETLRISSDTCQVLNRGYDYCSSFCSDPKGSFFFVGSNEKITRYNFDDLRTSELRLEDVNGAGGKISGICTLDGSTFYYVSEDYVMGKFNSDGFILEQALLNFNVDVILRDGYKPEKAQEIRDACKKYKFKATIPDECDKENPVVIVADVPMKEAWEAIISMREERIQCVVRIRD